MSEPRLLVITVSTRPKRIGGAIASWFADAAREIGGFEVVPVDLRELDLPLNCEPEHPRLHRYTKEITKQWSDTVRGADAVVWVTPEFNYAMTAAMKNALDYLAIEWAYLPTGFVSYGGVSGGLRGVEHAKQPMVALRCVPSSIAVTIPMVFGMITEDQFAPTPAVSSSVAPMIHDLLALHAALAGRRREALSALDA